jgi:hypothetical protein
VSVSISQQHVEWSQDSRLVLVASSALNKVEVRWLGVQCTPASTPGLGIDSLRPPVRVALQVISVEDSMFKVTLSESFTGVVGGTLRGVGKSPLALRPARVKCAWGPHVPAPTTL